MTKEEAIVAMKAGKKVAHRYFGEDEWVRSGLGITYEFEDGNVCTAIEFWKYRTEPEWETDWELFEEKPKPNHGVRN